MATGPIKRVFRRFCHRFKKQPPSVESASSPRRKTPPPSIPSHLLRVHKQYEGERRLHVVPEGERFQTIMRGDRPGAQREFTAMRKEIEDLPPLGPDYRPMKEIFKVLEIEYHPHVKPMILRSLTAIKFGRIKESNQIIIMDPTNVTSRRHLQFTFQDGQVYLEDNSLNESAVEVYDPELDRYFFQFSEKNFRVRLSPGIKYRIQIQDSLFDFEFDKKGNFKLWAVQYKHLIIRPRLDGEKAFEIVRMEPDSRPSVSQSEIVKVGEGKEAYEKLVPKEEIKNPEIDVDCGESKEESGFLFD